MADKWKPGVKILGTLGAAGKFPIALADQVSFANGTTLKDYIDARQVAGSTGAPIVGEGEPTIPAKEGIWYVDSSTGQVWIPDSVAAAADAK